MPHQGSNVEALALSPDSRRLVSSGGHALTIWNIDDGYPVKVVELEGHTDQVTSCTWSPDDALIASASWDSTVRIWDGHTYQQRDLLSMVDANLEFQGVREQSLQFSPDARYLAWISGVFMRSQCFIWQPLMDGQPKMLGPHPDHRGVYTAAFSFDGESRHIATSNKNFDNDLHVCTVRIWDAATGAPIAVLTGHSYTVSSISFSQDGKSLFSMDHDMSMRVWDCGTWSGKQTGVLRDAKHRSSDWGWWYVRGSDGQYVATGSAKGSVRLWRTSDGECVASFDEHDSFVIHQMIFPNSQFLVYGNTKGIVRIRSLSEFIGE